MHGLAHKSYLNYSYSRSQFSWLPQAVAEETINFFSQKVSYASIKIDPVINLFSLNEVKTHFHICYHSIITFGIILLCLGFSNTSYVDSLYRSRKSVVDKVKIDVFVF